MKSPDAVPVASSMSEVTERGDGVAPEMSMEEALNLLKAAGESTRLRVLRLLAPGELNVKDMTRILGQSQPRISRHLKLLDEAGLIIRHREGNWVYCRLTEDPARSAWVRDILERVRSEEPVFAADQARLDAIRAERAGEAERFFNEAASEWDRVRALQMDEAEIERAMLDLTGARRYRSMLDLGTGTGRMLELFADRVDTGTGIDISPTMLTHARAKLEKAGYGHCQLRQGDISQLLQDNAVAELVVLHQVLHFFDDPVEVLREAARVVAPGGHVMVVDFAPHGLEILREDFAHRRLGFGLDQMKQWLREAGLKHLQHKELTGAEGSDTVGLTVAIWLAAPSGAPVETSNQRDVAA